MNKAEKVLLTQGDKMRRRFGPALMNFWASLTVDKSFPIIHLLVGAWLSLVERSVRDREVGGSNPLAPTINIIPINSYREMFKVIRFPSGLFVTRILTYDGSR